MRHRVAAAAAAHTLPFEAHDEDFVRPQHFAQRFSYLVPRERWTTTAAAEPHEEFVVRNSCDVKQSARVVSSVSNENNIRRAIWI